MFLNLTLQCFVANLMIFLFILLTGFGRNCFTFGQSMDTPISNNNSACSSGTNLKMEKRFYCANGQLPEMKEIVKNTLYLGEIRKGAFLEDFFPKCNEKIIPTTSTTMSPTTTQESMEIPYLQKLKREMKEGGHILVKGHLNENPDFVQIFLLHNAPHDYLGDTVLGFQVEFNFNDEPILFSSYINGQRIYQNESDIIPKGNPFIPKQPFECRIEAQKDFFVISLNGGYEAKWTHRMPIWAVNWLRVDGSVTLSEVPEIFVPETIKSGTNFSVKLPNLLRVGDTIEFAGSVPPDANMFIIDLLHDTPEFNKQFGHLTMRLYVEFLRDEDMNRNSSVITANYYNNSMGKFDDDKVKWNVMQSPDTFFITIEVTKDEFLVNRIHKDNNTIEPILNYTQHLPAWTVDHIGIRHNVQIDDGYPTIKKQIESNKIKHLDEHLLQEGDVIKLTGFVNNSTDQGILVSLFSGALSHHDSIGKTVLEIHLLGDRFASFRSYYNGNYAEEENGAPEKYDIGAMPQMGQKLAFEIQVLSDSYNITISGKNDPDFTYTHQYYHILPAWAVDYIVVEGDFEVDGQIEIEGN